MTSKADKHLGSRLKAISLFICTCPPCTTNRNETRHNNMFIVASVFSRLTGNGIPPGEINQMVGRTCFPILEGELPLFSFSFFFVKTYSGRWLAPT